MAKPEKKAMLPRLDLFREKNLGRRRGGRVEGGEVVSVERWAGTSPEPSGLWLASERASRERDLPHGGPRADDHRDATEKEEVAHGKETSVEEEQASQKHEEHPEPREPEAYLSSVVQQHIARRLVGAVRCGAVRLALSLSLAAPSEFF